MLLLQLLRLPQLLPRAADPVVAAAPPAAPAAAVPSSSLSLLLPLLLLLLRLLLQPHLRLLLFLPHPHHAPPPPPACVSFWFLIFTGIRFVLLGFLLRENNNKRPGKRNKCFRKVSRTPPKPKRGRAKIKRGPTKAIRNPRKENAQQPSRTSWGQLGGNQPPGSRVSRKGLFFFGRSSRARKHS